MAEVVVGGAYPRGLEPSSLVTPANIFREKYLEAVVFYCPTVQCCDSTECRNKMFCNYSISFYHDWGYFDPQFKYSYHF